MAASRDGLDPRFAKKLAAFEQRLADHGVKVLLIDGHRSVEQQDHLYARGRTTPGITLTNNPGGRSWHNHGLAADYAFIINGRVTWNGPWEQFAQTARECGLEWGGDWDPSGSLHHVQWTNGRSIEEMRDRKSQEDSQHSSHFLSTNA